MKVKLNLGDWSQDGHNQTEVVILEVNKTVKEIQEAYLKSCKDSGVELHRLCSDYDENIIDDADLQDLEDFGIKWLFEHVEDNLIWDTTSFTNLILDFIKISLPDLTYKIVEDDIPNLNGFWGDLNVTFGYGLYTD